MTLLIRSVPVAPALALGVVARGDAAVARLGDAPQFAGLANLDELHRGNFSRACLRIEAGR